MFTDSHTHLYLEAFKDDRDEIIQRSMEAGVGRMLLPNIDSSSMEAMLDLSARYPENCFPMMGLHPTSVKENFRDELARVEEQLEDDRWIAIGECGIDLYWDKTFIKEQEDAFRWQIRWAMDKDLPLVIHARDSFEEIFAVMDETAEANLKGVFHSFSGGQKELEKVLSYGFMVGINGIVTFKNSKLAEVVSAIPAEHLLLETDAPFLTPAPHRGKRNESSYLPFIAARVAEIHNLSIEEVARLTSDNASRLFSRLPNE